MKKQGISLIVLVITIIIMIILAGAIILSLNSSNVTAKANWATLSSDRANHQAKIATLYADKLLADPPQDVTASDLGFASNTSTGLAAKSGVWAISGTGNTMEVVYYYNGTESQFKTAYGIDSTKSLDGWVKCTTGSVAAGVYSAT